MKEPFNTYASLLTSFLLVIILLISAGLFFKVKNTEPSLRGNQSNLITSVTQATTTVSQTRVRLLTANSGRQWARIELDAQNATNTVYLFLTAASTTVQAPGGIPLNATSTPFFEIRDSNLYLGEVWAVSTAGGARVHVTTN